MPLSVTLVTSARPCCGAAAAMMREIRVACDGAQKAKTLGPAPHMEDAYAPARSAASITSCTHG